MKVGCAEPRRGWLRLARRRRDRIDRVALRRKISRLAPAVSPTPHFPLPTPMTKTRREFLKTAAAGLSVLPLAGAIATAAEPKEKAKKAAGGGSMPSFAKKSKMKLGTVTYNLAMDW